ncbi:exopolygalacturonase-like [Phalaenopsis equestris]|uniref:exopolygalacturonase-like n=1 Tax=Phalaenopsis equestris TaxID=78828 RepID=UPI0009E32DE5|nr:exopolygalacturonase-like [Phalaenopsis equestris]
MDSNIWLLFIIFLVAHVNICRGNNFTEKVFDVTSYGASPDGQNDSTQAFLKAWNEACTTDCGLLGRAKVLIPEGTFLTGPLCFRGLCKSAMVVEVNGMIVAPTDLRVFRKEWIVFRYVNGLLITGSGGINGLGATAWRKRKGNRLPPSLKLMSVTNTHLQSISFTDSKFFHVLVGQSAHVTIKSINISAPGNSPNTDGIHISESIDVQIQNSTIGSGDDCISIGSGSKNVTVRNVFCGPGHGISVGSLGKYKYDLGVDGIYVTNCTLSRTTNGVRIKTWRDSPAINATNLRFYDIVMEEVENPIIIDQEYCPGTCDDDKPPSRVKISGVTFEKIRGTSATDVAINLLCSSTVPCDIKLKDIDLRPMPPSPGMLPTVPLSTCIHVGNATAEGYIFPPACF